MFISPKLNAGMNAQIGHEFAASQQYVAIAAWFASETLPSLSGKFFEQSAEERGHALKFVRYILDAGGKVEIPALPAPKSTFTTVEEVVKLSLEREKEVTRQISDLMALAVKEANFTAQQFLGWFVTEQLEEVSSMEALLKIVQRAGEKNLLFVEGFIARAAAAQK